MVEYRCRRPLERQGGILDRRPDFEMPSLAPEAARPVATVALEIDVQTALALSRATSRAVIAISPKAHRAMMDALGVEAATQEAQGGPVGELVAALIKGHLDQLR
jgi:hypothetical protein